MYRTGALSCALPGVVLAAVLITPTGSPVKHELAQLHVDLR